jgi:predicted outer membrane repeat protein
MGAAALAVAALTAATPAAQAQSAKARIVPVPCSSTALASAITAANTTPATLRLSQSCVYLLGAALPQITGNVTLLGGPSTSIKRNPATPNVRILDVALGGTLRVEGVFILHGSSSTADGGGIRNAGALTLNHVTLSGNAAMGFSGGALANTGTAVITSTVFTANVNQGAVGTREGGAIFNDGTLTVQGSRIDGNVSAHDGGGIYTTATHTTRIIQTTFSGNTAVNLGGALYNNGTTTLDRSRVELNLAVGATAGGGGIFNAAGTVTITGSILTKNGPDNCQPLSGIPGCVG